MDTETPLYLCASLWRADASPRAIPLHAARRSLPSRRRLVDSRTASASEILSSALQDNGRAKLIGCSGARPRGRDGRRRTSDARHLPSPAAGPRTFGKAVIQTVSPLSDGSGIIVTTARYQTPKRIDINKKGIAVDMEQDCPISTEAAKCLPSKLV